MLRDMFCKSSPSYSRRDHEILQERQASGSAFWKAAPRPIIGLSPMDGVTDAAFRFMTAKYGKPGVMYTEFVSAEGLASGAVKLLEHLKYGESERPILAQIFGSNPEAFYKAAVLISALGFDGLDINMGCPARNVSEHGGGAALIKNPELALQLVQSAKEGIGAWAGGISLEAAGISPEIISNIKALNDAKRRQIPVSVKTRIGYDKDIAEFWADKLAEAKPDAVCFHGRTLKQMYSGAADWDAISRAAAVFKKADIVTLGNGDVKNISEAKEKAASFGVGGVLIGRAAMGNPWLFSEHLPTPQEKLDAAVEHAQRFERMLPNRSFMHMRKHLGWYAAGFTGAKELRTALMQSDVKSAEKVHEIIRAFDRGMI
jgi:nifR3 family TIM-barrel protein